MAKRYSISGTQNAGAAKTILGLTSAATIRPRIYEVIFGSAATPADQAFNMQMNRYTAAGTATAFTPVALEPADPASLASAGATHTVEPTYTSAAVVKSFSINQQATMRWIVLPEQAIVLPSTAANGVGLKFVTVSGGTALCEAEITYEE